MLVRWTLATLTLLSVVVAASAERPTVEIRPVWRMGDAVRYQMTKTQQREFDGKVLRKVQTTTPVEVEVIEMDDDGIVLRWRQGSTTFEDPKHDDDPVLRTLHMMFKALDIDVQLDTEGVLIGLRNWKELRGTGHKVQEAILTQMAKSGTAKSTLDTVRKETDKLLATQESLETAFLQYPALLVFPLGTSYEMGQTLTYETTIPNIFGGPTPFPALGEYQLKALDKDSDMATIIFKQSLHPKESPRILQQWLAEEAKKTGKPAPGELPDFQIQDIIEYEIDCKTGWVKSVTLTRNGKMDKLTATETVTLLRKTP
ncbi:MAG: hypothetical protein RMJ56_00020 [Gemmataceae bacterium]|nr:hypothetical protein [Gemmata sp.]MDW8195966.1 hypothetical protein [Gemmataceae bacterium]